MTYAPSPTPTPAPARRPRRALLLVALAAAVVLLGGLVVGIAYFGGGGPTLEAAEKACNDGIPGTDLVDAGKTLIVDMEGPVDTVEGKGGVNAADVTCILDKLGAPAAVVQKMASTRALDGRQTESWGDFTATYTYHPDRGLDMTIEQR